MTLLLPDNQPAPVFDQPPQQKSKKSFFARRFISLAGKPILAEKNLPIAPSNSNMARKCYTAPSQNLYKGHNQSSLSLQFKPRHKVEKFDQDYFENHPDLTFCKKSLSFSTPKIAVDPMSPLAQKITAKLNFYPEERKICFTDSGSKSGRQKFPENQWAFRQVVPGEQCLKTIAATWNSIAKHSNKDCSINAGINKGQCPELKAIHSDQQLTWENRFSPDKTSFYPINPDLRPFSLQTKTGNVSPGNDSYHCSSRKISRSHRPMVKIDHSPAGFDNNREWISNLVLDHKALLSPVVSLKPGPHHPPAWKCNKIRKESPSFVARNLVKAPTENHIFAALPLNPCSNILSSPPRTLNARFSINSILPPEVKKPHFNTTPPRVPWANRDRLKLKLRLSKAAYEQRETSMLSLDKNKIMPAGNPLKKPLKAIFKPLQRVEKKYNKFSLATNPSAFNKRAEHFVQKRSHHQVTATRHARYTVNLLKKLHAANLREKRVDTGRWQSSWFQKNAAARQKNVFKPMVASEKVFSPILAIRLRPASFLMYIAAMNFTDICLPAWKRRLKAPPGNFDLPTRKNTGARRKTTLRSLRFRLSSINNGFIDNRSKALRKITCNPAHLSIKVKGASELIIPPVCAISTRHSIKTFVPAFRGHLEKFSYRYSLPTQIKTEINLEQTIIGFKNPHALVQKDFIIPQIWQPTSKKFNCRMKLHPFPFGFPTFVCKKAIFAQLTSRGMLSHSAKLIERVSARFDLILRREQQINSPLSMKNPRRLLHKTISPADFPGDLFHEAKTITRLSVRAAIQVSEFTHFWESYQEKRVSDRARPLDISSTPRSRPAFFKTSQTSSLSTFARRQTTGQTSIDMPAVKKHLLRARRFKAQYQQLLPEEMRLDATGRTPELSFISPSEQRIRFTPVDNLFKFNNFPELEIKQIFPAPVLASIPAQKQYRARFRLFRFPYRPEFNELPTVQQDFSQIEDTPELTDNFFADEMRARDFNFSFSTINQSNMKNYGGMNLQNQGISRADFAVNIPESAQIDWLLPKTLPAKRIKNPLIEFAEYYEAETFFKTMYSGYFRLKKVIKPSQNLCDHVFSKQNSSLLPFSNTHDAGFRFSKLSMSSVHWIILLRSFMDANSATMDFQIDYTATRAEMPISLAYLYKTFSPDYVNRKRQTNLALQRNSRQKLPMNDFTQSRIYMEFRHGNTEKISPAPDIFSKNEIITRPPQMVEKTIDSPRLATAQELMKIDSGQNEINRQFAQCTSLPIFAKQQEFSISAISKEYANYRHQALPEWFDLKAADKLLSISEIPESSIQQ